MLFEMLEQRLLLSADPLAAVQAGVLTAELTGGSDTLVLTQVGRSAGGGVIVDLTMGTVTTRFGDDDAGISSIVVDGGAGDDSYRFVGLEADVSVQGGEGDDTLAWEQGDATWTIDAAGAGRVGTLSFSSIENLQGAADNQDNFSFDAAGSIAGRIDGGAGGYDTLTLAGGSFDTVSFQASSPDAGEVRRDADTIRYAGLEPITDNSTSLNKVFVLTAGDDDAVLAQVAPGQFKLSSSTATAPATFESVQFSLAAGGSVSIDALGGADSVTLNSADFGDMDITVLAEHIHVPSTAVVRSTGDITLRATASGVTTSDDEPVALSAQVQVDGTMEVGGALVLQAIVQNTVDVDVAGAAVGIESATQAVARIGADAHVTAGTLTVSANTQTQVAIDITDAAAGSSGVGTVAFDAGRAEATLLSGSDSVDFYGWDTPAIDNAKDTYVVIHGWMGGLETSFYDLLNAVRAHDAEANILFVDWSAEARNPVYPDAAADTYDIGQRVADYLGTLGLDPATITLIGHSLGGQVSGVAADRYQAAHAGQKIARIFALDPAGPYFEPTLGQPAQDAAHRLDAGDASRVVVLHTTTVLGYDDAAGHLDLHVNPGAPQQPGSTDFVGNHSYAKTLMAQLLRGETFGQQSANLVGADLAYSDFLDTALLGNATVETRLTPITVATVASIDGGAQVRTGTAAISADETASLLVQALDNVDIRLDISTDGALTATAYDYIEGLVGIDRDTRASIGGAGQQTSIGLASAAAGLVKVSARNSGSLASRVHSDFLTYRSTTFARDSVVASVENATVYASGLAVQAENSSSYTTTAQETGNTVRGEVTASIRQSTVTVGAQGITVKALDHASYAATSAGDGSRSSYNDIAKDVSAFVDGSSLTAEAGQIRISADGSAVVRAVSTLSANGTLFATANILAINVVNGDVEAYAQDSTLTTTGAGDISLSAQNSATIDSRIVADATPGTPLLPALSFGSAAAYNAVGWDMTNVLLATVEDLLGDPAKEWIAGILPFGENDPSQAKAWLLDTEVSAAGGLALQARTAPQVNATVSNAAQSTSSSLYGSFSGAGGGVLASNKIASGAEAWIDFSDAWVADNGQGQVQAEGDVSVRASDDAGIYSNSKFVASSITTNDGGLHFAGQAAGAALEADHTTADGTQDIAFGDKVFLLEGYAAGGNDGGVYQYMGTAASGAGLDLGTQDYADQGFWKQVPET
ncbi:MAG TPA: LEPR-XLL domain-containing protein, partial [Ramlibacter sp.]|nr:LEPR-XLL domain-containing protein [Ramlibacter sp.]